MYEFLKLLNKGPVTVGLNANKLWTYYSGIIDDSDPTVCPPDSLPNHAVLAIGYKIDL